MRNHITRILGITAATLLLAASAQAQGKAKAQHHVAKHRTAEVYGRDIYRGVSNRDISGRKVPPGLAKKPGQMPPGQYKKRYGNYEGGTILGDIMRRRDQDRFRGSRADASRRLAQRY